MSEDKRLPTGGERVKKALAWLSEELDHHPQKGRNATLKEAQIRFDLSPAECDFLEKNFSGRPGDH